MADAVRHDQVDQKSDHSVRQAQEVEISMLEVDSGACVAARQRDHHQKQLRHDPGQRLRFALLHPRARRPVGGPQRICGEERENVGEDQLLMLLLMIDADLNDLRQLRSGFNAAREKRFEPGVHMGAVGEDAIAGRPREEPAHSPRLAGPMRF